MDGPAGILISVTNQLSKMEKRVMNNSVPGTKSGVILLLTIMLAGCGGAKVLKEPYPVEANEPLAVASDTRLTATLDWVIVRDGPGTWSRNADWDEYLIRIQNQGNEPIQITNVVVTDTLGTRIEPAINRKRLVRASRQTVRRYKGEGLKVKAGAGTGTMMAISAGVGATAAALAGSAGVLSSGGAAIALGGVILVPTIAVGSVVRGVNNSKVNKQIETRQTMLPIEVGGELINLNIFFPLAPSPQQVEIHWVDSTGEHSVVMDTRAALDGLHLQQSAN